MRRGGRAARSSRCPFSERPTPGSFSEDIDVRGWRRQKEDEGEAFTRAFTHSLSDHTPFFLSSHLCLSVGVCHFAALKQPLRLPRFDPPLFAEIPF